MIMIKNLCNKDGQFIIFKITDVFINTQKRGRVNEILDYYTDIVFLSVPQLKRFVNNKK